MPESGDSGRAAARGTARIALAHGLSHACGVAVVVMLARGLGPKVYGHYGVILSVLVATELIGRLGVPQATSKLIAESRGGARELERTGLTLTALVFLAIFAGFWLAAPALARLLGVPDGARLFRLAAIDIPFYGLYFACEHIVNGHRRFGAESAGIALYGASKAAGVGLLYLLGMTIEGALIANIAASVLGLAFLATRVPRGAFRPSLSGLAPIARLALPTALFLLASEVLANLDLWTLKIVARDVSADTVGHYVAATNVGRLPAAAWFVAAAVLVPVLSRALSTGDEERARRTVRAAVRALVLVLLPVCALFAVRAEELMTLAYSGRYLAGAPFEALQVFRFGLGVVFLMTFCAVQMARGRAGQAARGLLLMIPVGLVAHTLAVRARGAEGAALSAVLVAAAAAVAAGWPVWRWARPLLRAETLLRAALAATLVALVAARYPIAPPLLALELPLLLAAYAALLWLAGELGPADLAPFRRKRAGGPE